jgi:hypothetical protein
MNVTEVDITVLEKDGSVTDGFEKLAGGVQNNSAELSATMETPWSTPPQVSADEGSISDVSSIVTTDGAGPVGAMIDFGATDAFLESFQAKIVTDS